MSELYNRILELCKTKGISGYRLCKDAGIQPSVLSDLKMGRQNGLSAKNADKIASCLGVTVSYLLGTEPEQTQSSENARQIADADIKAAFWGGEKDLAPEEVEELWQDVKDYVKFKTEQKRKGK